MANPATDARRAAANGFTQVLARDYNGYVMVQNSTIVVGNKIRINSTDYDAKRVEPQT
jgi:hypothetical protein